MAAHYKKILVVAFIGSTLVASHKTGKTSVAPRVSMSTMYNQTLRNLGREKDSEIMKLATRQLTIDRDQTRSLKNKLKEAMAKDLQDGQDIKKVMDYVYDQPATYLILELYENYPAELPQGVKEKVLTILSTASSDFREAIEIGRQIEQKLPGFQNALRERYEANNITTMKHVADALEADVDNESR